jgi:very-short-patch-repair endonuclease
VSLSKYELLFDELLREGDFPPYVREYRVFPPRRWRIDFAWPEPRAGVEIDGGQWAYQGGRHNTDSDREKHNTLVLNGWRVLRFSGTYLEDQPDECIATVKRLLNIED